MPAPLPVPFDAAALESETFALPDARLSYRPRFLAPADSADLLRELLATLAWRDETLVIAGRRVAVPRRVAWYGDPGARYRYSGVDHEPLPWTAALAALKARVEAAVAAPFNSVLANLYRDGRDSMGWHSDAEPELGPEPVIASLSLGAARRFRLQHKTRKDLRRQILLADGSLLVMAGPCQRRWRHALPKDPAVSGPRINLTFRHIRIPD